MGTRRNPKGWAKRAGGNVSPVAYHGVGRGQHLELCIRHVGVQSGAGQRGHHWPLRRQQRWRHALHVLSQPQPHAILRGRARCEDCRRWRRPWLGATPFILGVSLGVHHHLIQLPRGERCVRRRDRAKQECQLRIVTVARPRSAADDAGRRAQARLRWATSRVEVRSALTISCIQS